MDVWQECGAFGAVQTSYIRVVPPALGVTYRPPGRLEALNASAVQPGDRFVEWGIEVITAVTVMPPPLCRLLTPNPRQRIIVG